MECNLKINIRIDDASTNKISRFKNEKSPIICDESDNKIYRLKIVNGTLTQQEVDVQDGNLVEIGDPITYVKA